MNGLMTDMQELAGIESRMEALTAQMAILAEQMQFLTDQARASQARQRVWADLQDDAGPIIKELYEVGVERFGEIEDRVQAEDLARLAFRLLRNARTFEAMLDQLESATDLLSDVAPLTSDAMNQAVATFGLMEQRGYFGFARQLLVMGDRIVTSFTEDDVRQLGDNIVLILKTVKAMTQPEIMTMVNTVTTGLQNVEQHPEALPTSVGGLLRQMGDPDVRRGLAVMMVLLKLVAQQPAYPTQPTMN